MSVFENYQFDTKTSEFLINSNILELIKKTYTRIAQTGHRADKKLYKRTFRQFLFEHQRLVESWNYIDSN